MPENKFKIKFLSKYQKLSPCLARYGQGELKELVDQMAGLALVGGADF